MFHLLYMIICQSLCIGSNLNYQIIVLDTCMYACLFFKKTVSDRVEGINFGFTVRI